ncbi:MAG: AMP-binding protein, partial [Vicinamibacterales bacterium]
AYILPTGGTTGAPKAVTLSHANLVANAWQQFHWAGGKMGEETFLAVLPFFHSYGLSATMMTGTAMAATLILHHRFNTRMVLRLIEQHRTTVFHAVPAMLNAMNERLRRKPSDLSSLKWVISGGASLPIPVADEFAKHSGALVVEGYGLSECSPVTHVGPLNESSRRGTIGLPLPDTDCRIVDAETGATTVAPGEVGELIVRGPQIMLGYWNHPEETAATFRDGWLHTGDLAACDEDGFYRIVDRKKDLIITSGYNVYPAEVEAVLRTCPGVKDAAVIGVPDERRGEIVKAMIVLAANADWDEDHLHRFCREHLSAHKRPRLFEEIDGDLPRNFLGKVVRRHLRETVSVTEASA